MTLGIDKLEKGTARIKILIITQNNKHTAIKYIKKNERLRS